MQDDPVARPRVRADVDSERLGEAERLLREEIRKYQDSLGAILESHRAREALRESLLRDPHGGLLRESAFEEMERRRRDVSLQSGPLLNLAVEAEQQRTALMAEVVRKVVREELLRIIREQAVAAPLDPDRPRIGYPGRS